ncbi:MAG: hypothetical protein ACOYL5_14565 [Phototrophicaceae bacterium]|jgi:hypothetical protein
MPHKGKLKQILLSTVEKLQTRRPDGWFSRRQIAEQLGTESVHLNPARIGALKTLVEEGKLQLRQRPDDGRDLPEYRLP